MTQRHRLSPEERARLLQAVGWTGRELARRAECDDSTIRRYLGGFVEQPQLDQWLTRTARRIEQDPAPRWQASTRGSRPD